MNDATGGRAELVDVIVPPPWSGPRRLLVAIPVLLSIALLGGLWWSGVFGPNLGAVRGYSWGPVEVDRVPAGADGLVEVELLVHNRGWLPVDIIDVWAPPFTGAAIEFDEPVTIGPRHEGRLRFAFVVTDCAELRAAPQPRLSVVASSGLTTQHGRQLRILGAHGQPATWDDAPTGEQPSWWYALAEPVCDPDFLAG